MKANKITTNLAVENIKQTVSFYTETLGFQLIMAVPESQDGVDEQIHDNKEYVYALMQKDNVQLMFQRIDSFNEDISLSEQAKIGASASFYMEIEGLDDFHKKLTQENLVKTEVKTTWYGMKEFYIKDNNGYILGFAEKAN